MVSLQIATVEVPEEHMGSVVELLGKRRGQMFDMQGVGYVKSEKFSSCVLFITIWHSIEIIFKFWHTLA